MDDVGKCVISSLGIDISNQSNADTPRNDNTIVYSITSVKFIPDISFRNILTNFGAAVRSDFNAMIRYYNSAAANSLRDCLECFIW